MPIYEYKCRCGKSHDKFHKVNRIPKTSRCECGWLAKRVIAGSGAIQCDSINDVSWLPSACKTLLKHGEPMLQSRSEYKRYLAQHDLVCKG